MDTAPDLDTVLHAAGHKHRRIVLAMLANQQESIPINELTDAIIKHNHHSPPPEMDDERVKRIYIGLHHSHLPQLAEAGLIHYDPERNVVEPAAQLGREGAKFSAILAMDSELPGS